MDISSKSFRIKSILIIFSVLMFVFVVSSKNILSVGLTINELSFSNNGGNDWVEIYNSSFNSRSLKGMYITDNKTDFKRFEIESDVVVPANGFVVFYGKDHSESENNKDTSLNFNIKNGETVFLIDQNLRIIDSLTAIQTQESQIEQTVGRFPDGSEDTFLISTPSAGETNVKDMNTPLMNEL